MPTLVERQNGILRYLAGGAPDSDFDSGFLGVVNPAEVLRLRNAIAKGRVGRLRAALPVTVQEIWMDFGAVAADYAASRPMASIDAGDDVSEFVEFLAGRLATLFDPPPYLIDLARFELAAFEARFELAPSGISDGPIVDDRFEVRPQIWEGDFELAPLFSGGVRADVRPASRSTCAIWRDVRTGRLRVARLSTAAASALRGYLAEPSAGAEFDPSVMSALRGLGLVAPDGQALVKADETHV